MTLSDRQISAGCVNATKRIKKLVDDTLFNCTRNKYNIKMLRKQKNHAKLCRYVFRMDSCVFHHNYLLEAAIFWQWLFWNERALTGRWNVSNHAWNNESWHMTLVSRAEGRKGLVSSPNWFIDRFPLAVIEKNYEGIVALLSLSNIPLSFFVFTANVFSRWNIKIINSFTRENAHDSVFF